jgi:hypothetical protein
LKAGIRQSAVETRQKRRCRIPAIAAIVLAACTSAFAIGADIPDHPGSAPAGSRITAPRSEHVDEPGLPIPDSGPSISLLTIGPGPIFWERFGHNALVVRDPATGTALSYNYGIFDFGQDDFLLNFVRGRMQYRIVAGTLADDLAMYRDEGRSIDEQALALTPGQARNLASFLAWNARPENATYRYDYFTANCSTRVRDALDHVLGGALRRQGEGRSRGYSYRMDALRLMAPEPVLMLLIDLGLGPFADQRLDFWQEGFVPASLAVTIGDVALPDAPAGTSLVASTRRLAAGSVIEPPSLPPDLRWPFLVAGLAVGCALIWLGRLRHRLARIGLAAFAGTFELVCGLGGLVLLFLWFGTEHRAAWRNENLLLLDPLCLLLAPAWFASVRRRWRPSAGTRGLAGLVALVAGFALLSKVLPWFPQENLAWIVLLLPIHVALAVVAIRRGDVYLAAR